ncbi:MAG: hypothetical protein M1404_02160 [Acidobacteria bacterium]|nr:hypothetical protein [Acidobacteriota bacterium]
MRDRSSRTLLLVLAATFGILAVEPINLSAADLSPATVKAFDRYVKVAEAQMDCEGNHPGHFLYIDRLPKPQYDQVMAMLKQGQVYVARLQAREPSGKEIEVPGGMIHHWIGAVLVPGSSLSMACKVLQNYNDYTAMYKPEVIRSRLISHEDDNYKIYLRLQKKSIVTVTLDTWYDVHFSRLDATRACSRSYSTRIQQVEDAGTPSEHLDPVGHDSGYLWRIDSYWRYEQRKDGVIIEWESISLSRQIPFWLAWFVRPLVRNIARETVQDMLLATRKAILAEEKPAQTQVKSLHRPLKPAVSVEAARLR